MSIESSPTLDDANLYRAAAEAGIVYGSQTLPRRPDEIIMEAEEPEDEQSAIPPAEILLKLLAFAGAGQEIVSKGYWRRIGRRIPPGHAVHYHRHSCVPAVLFVRSDGEVIAKWEPAKLKSINAPRPHKQERNRRCEILVWEGVPENIATRIGQQLLSLAQLTQNPIVSGFSGADLANALGQTRQAVSLRNKQNDQRIKEATGGKAGARGLRHRADPRKGLTKEEIEARKQSPTPPHQ